MLYKLHRNNLLAFAWNDSHQFLHIYVKSYVETKEVLVLHKFVLDILPGKKASFIANIG